jgi:hypothetical protein
LLHSRDRCRELAREFAADAPFEFGALSGSERGEALFPGQPRRPAALAGAAPLLADI